MRLTMVGRLSECVLLAYRVKPDAVGDLVPPGLELVLHEGHAFWNVVACRVEKMRPAGVPRSLGLSYNHVAYRLYVRAGRVDGLFFVRSDADSRLICAAGNVMTDFRFHASQIALRSERGRVYCGVRGEAAAELVVEEAEGAVLPADSAFASAEQVARFLKYRPVALSVSRGGRLKITSVQRHEPDWHEGPLRVVTEHLAFLERFGPRRRELATRVRPLDYRWVLGGLAV